MGRKDNAIIRIYKIKMNEKAKNEEKQDIIKKKMEKNLEVSKKMIKFAAAKTRIILLTQTK